MLKDSDTIKVGDLGVYQQLNGEIRWLRQRLKDLEQVSEDREYIVLERKKYRAGHSSRWEESHSLIDTEDLVKILTQRNQELRTTLERQIREKEQQIKALAL